MKKQKPILILAVHKDDKVEKQNLPIGFKFVLDLHEGQQNTNDIILYKLVYNEHISSYELNLVYGKPPTLITNKVSMNVFMGYVDKYEHELLFCREEKIPQYSSFYNTLYLSTHNINQWDSAINKAIDNG